MLLLDIFTQNQLDSFYDDLTLSIPHEGMEYCIFDDATTYTRQSGSFGEIEPIIVVPLDGQYWYTILDDIGLESLDNIADADTDEYVKSVIFDGLQDQLNQLDDLYTSNNWTDLGTSEVQELIIRTPYDLERVESWGRFKVRLIPPYYSVPLEYNHDEISHSEGLLHGGYLWIYNDTERIFTHEGADSYKVFTNADGKIIIQARGGDVID